MGRGWLRSRVANVAMLACPERSTTHFPGPAPARVSGWADALPALRMHSTAPQTLVAATAGSSPAVRSIVLPSATSSAPRSVCQSPSVRSRTVSTSQASRVSPATANVMSAPCDADILTSCTATSGLPSPRCSTVPGRPSSRLTARLVCLCRAFWSPLPGNMSGSTTHRGGCGMSSARWRSRYGPRSTGSHGPSPSFLRTARSCRPSQRSRSRPPGARISTS